MIRLKWVESQFYSDELHVRLGMAGGCPGPVPAKICLLGALELSACQCSISDELIVKNFSRGGGTFSLPTFAIFFIINLLLMDKWLRNKYQWFFPFS